MSRPLKIGLGGLLLTALCWLGLYVLQQLQPYEETIEHGPSPEARANDYLAAELFLRQQKITVKRADGLDVLTGLPAAGQTLMLLGPRRNMTPRQARQVLDWAAKGGHLLFVAEEVWDEEEGRSGDLLLDSLGVQQSSTYEEDEDEGSEDSGAEAGDEELDVDADAEVELENDADAADDEQSEQSEASEEKTDEDRYPELTKIYLENEEAPAYAEFDTDYHLLDTEDRAYAWANSGEATHMLQLEHGEGLITVVTDAWLWQNDNIGDYDNAWLLWYLSQDSAVTLVYSAERDDLFSQLFRHYPAALAALALLIVLLLWHVGMRHGPLQAPQLHARRQLEEHLRAGADFLLRRAGQQHLLSNLQRDILRRARHRHPGFERLAVAEQWQVLGRLTRLPSGAIGAAMRPLPAQRLSAADFTRQVANLQTLRNAL
jgi:predicted  nucleic acid-binding Zn-ribbon protein